MTAEIFWSVFGLCRTTGIDGPGGKNVLSRINLRAEGRDQKRDPLNHAAKEERGPRPSREVQSFELAPENAGTQLR